MRFAYCDPPYLGVAQKLYGHLHPDAAVYDTLEGHAALIAKVDAEYDAWAYSLSSPSLKRILSVCPDDVRVSPWVKPFASYKPNVNPAYCWEPIIWRGGRRRGRDEPTVRDYVSCNITLERGLTGAKPEEFCSWLFDVLGAQPDDEFHDVFYGSGAVTDAWAKWRNQTRLIA